MSQARRTALALGGSALVLTLALLIAPLISRTGSASVFDDLHLPRAVMGAIAGCGLAICGVVLQATLKNPLASPYTLGISSGASVGAYAAIRLSTLGIGLQAASSWGITATALGALAGGLLAAALVYAVAAQKSLAADTLLLAGVAVALFSGAAITALHWLSTMPEVRTMFRWSMGDLEVVGWHKPQVCGGFLVAGLLVLAPVLRELDVASLDDASARGLGVDPVRVRRLVFAGTSVITAGVVALVGPVGFVGLVVPHMVRPFTGPSPRLLLPCAGLIGGALLIVCDTVGRQLLYPTNLPANVITSALGCPVFVWILIRRSGGSS